MALYITLRVLKYYFKFKQAIYDKVIYFLKINSHQIYIQKLIWVIT